MMTPTIYYNFLNPDASPEQVYFRFEKDTPQARDLMNQFPIQKVLTERDTIYCQVIMRKDQVEEYILPHLLPDQQNSVTRGDYMPITVRDLETMTEHPLCLWKNGSSSYVLTRGWSSAFVKRRRLEVGEEIGFCWDPRFGELRFSVLSRPPFRFQERFALDP